MTTGKFAATSSWTMATWYNLLFYAENRRCRCH